MAYTLYIMSKMQRLQHISSEHECWLNYLNCRIHLNKCYLVYTSKCMKF